MPLNTKENTMARMRAVRGKVGGPHNAFRARSVAAVGWHQLHIHVKPGVLHNQLNVFEVPPSAAAEVLKAFGGKPTSTLECGAEEAIGDLLVRPCASEPPVRGMQPLISTSLSRTELSLRVKRRNIS